MIFAGHLCFADRRRKPRVAECCFGEHRQRSEVKRRESSQVSVNENTGQLAMGITWSHGRQRKEKRAFRQEKGKVMSGVKEGKEQFVGREKGSYIDTESPVNLGVWDAGQFKQISIHSESEPGVSALLLYLR